VTNSGANSGDSALISNSGDTNSGAIPVAIPVTGNSGDSALISEGGSGVQIPLSYSRGDAIDRS
jgi:hypothetical protein